MGIFLNAFKSNLVFTRLSKLFLVVLVFHRLQLASCYDEHDPQPQHKYHPHPHHQYPNEHYDDLKTIPPNDEDNDDYHDHGNDHYKGEHITDTHYDPRKEEDFFDLTYTFDNNSIAYPGQRFDFELYRDVGPTRNRTRIGNYEYSYASYSFCVSEHVGTHIDAPFHFNRFGWKLNEIPLKRLVDVPGVVVDVEHHVFSLRNPDRFVLQVEHLLEHEKKYGKIIPGSVVLVRFGWGKFWPDRMRYAGWRNSSFWEQPTLNFPGLSGKSASWLLRERRVIGVGTDTMSTDVGNEMGNPVAHIILLESQVYLLENVAHLDDFVKKTRTYHKNSCPNLRLFVMPVKTEGTGGPTRIVAYCKN